ncbi:MAG: PAS domain-containing protein [Opitutaceae bacterium]|nr:PAS domain-containing protein [Opitutaceae bacterium]
MPDPLKLLIAEDHAADAELMVRALRGGGFAPEWRRVDTEPDYRAHLGPDLDLVLADFRMPQFSARRALEVLQELGLDIPFIIVSGTIGEETAVAAMKDGATDYLLKDRLARLPQCARQALAQRRLRRERQQALAALQLSEERFRRTIDNLMEGCQIIGRDWRYLYVNQAATRHGQRPAAELIGRTMMECYPGIDGTAMFATLRRCLEDGQARQIENEFPYADGSAAWFQLVIQPVPDGLFILSLDITARKRAEERIRGQLDELQRWQDVMLNREERITSLKTEVNELLARLGEPPRYAAPPAP